MKLSTINAAAGILSGMKINKIADKDVKNALVSDYIAMRKVLREANEDTQEVIKKFQEDWRDELAPVDALRKENKPVVGHDEYLDAEKDANIAIAAIMGKDVEIDVKAVEMDKFISAAGDEDISFEQVALLQECGIIK